MLKTEDKRISEILDLYNLPLKNLIELSSKVTTENFEKKVELCSIVSAKTGECPEDCKYCSQSLHYKTQVKTHDLLPLKKIKKAAETAKENGATRFCIVTSGRKPNKEEFKQILKMIETVANIEDLHACSSLGILNEKEVYNLKNAGLERYNHNLNTCKSFHKEICTTHEYEDRLNTVKLIKSNGIEACTGGIIGMGETREQRIELALELAELSPKSVPINFLSPIKGTPLENIHPSINEEEILRTICIFRIILPKSLIRYAGGRTTRLSTKNQEIGIKAGVNALLIGNYLTTTGNTPEKDLEMITKLGLSPSTD